jgi:hypothetical protein
MERDRTAIIDDEEDLPEIEEVDDEEEVVEDDEEEELQVAPPEPTYDINEVRRMIDATIQEEETKKKIAQARAEMDKLFEDDPAEYARRRKAMDDLGNVRQQFEQQAKNEYYTNLFKDVMPQIAPVIEQMTPEEKAALNPDLPKWQSDGQYLAALMEAVSDKKAELKAQEVERKYKAGKARQAANPDYVPDIPPGTGPVDNVLTKDSRAYLLEALRETVGKSVDIDDSD